MESTAVTQKVPCSICGCAILPLTARRTGGVCRPCYYRIFGHVRGKPPLPRVPVLAYDNDTIIAESVRMRGVLALVKLVAESDLPVLIAGDAGTGKKLLGREIHRLSRRSDKPLFVRDCIPLPDGVILCDFFGSVGDCVGGRDVHPGVLERTSGGTFVLGNICHLSLWSQEKLAPMLQRSEFKRFVSLFDEVTVKFDVRLVATTRHSLPRLIASGDFNQDLYSYISGFTIHIPLLRERREDIPALLDHYLPLAAAGLTATRKKLAPEVVEFFLSYPWPGNISELQAVLEFGVIHSRGDTVRMEDLPFEVTGVPWAIVLSR